MKMAHKATLILHARFNKRPNLTGLIGRYGCEPKMLCVGVSLTKRVPKKAFWAFGKLPEEWDADIAFCEIEWRDIIITSRKVYERINFATALAGAVFWVWTSPNSGRFSWSWT